MTTKRQTLLSDRVQQRLDANWLTYQHHIRAELDRLARQIRKLDKPCKLLYRAEVLDLIQQAKQ